MPIRGLNLLGGMSLIGSRVLGISLERKSIVRILRTSLMNDLVWTPVDEILLVCRSPWVRRHILRHVRLSLLFGLHIKRLIGDHRLSVSFNMMGVDDFVLLFNVEGLASVLPSNCL